MKFRNFLRILIPVCALAATVSCTNEELIVQASQSKRGRDFAEAFKARFQNIDPNHTWIDGTVGKVVVTTEEPTNIVIYGLGRSDLAAIRLKRCVVDGTQMVKYDVPLGCKSVVMRAYNNHGNSYKTLNPEQEDEEATFYLAPGSRGATDTDISTLTPMNRQLIPNVWNAYGSMAPWETTIPNVSGIIEKYDECDHDHARRIADTGDVQWEYYNEDMGLCYYFHYDRQWPNHYDSNNIPSNVWHYASGDPVNWGMPTWSTPSHADTPNNYYYNIYHSGKPLGYAYWVPTFLFSSDAEFEAVTGLSYGTDADDLSKYRIIHENGGNPANSIPLKPGQEYDDASPRWGPLHFPAGDYYCFNPSGKRGAWEHHRGRDYGKFYVSNIDISGTPPDKNDAVLTDTKVDGSDYLNNTQQYFHTDLSGEVIDQILNISQTAENHPQVLRQFNTNLGLETLRDGPVSVTWFYSQTTTRDYVGYYYVTGEDNQENCDKAAKYLLLEATCTGEGVRQAGDTFPLTYYGPDPENPTAPSFTFPAGTKIHFFILHGRDGSANTPNPNSGPNTNADRWVDEQGWKPCWTNGDPNWMVGISGFQPESHNNRNEWLFYDHTTAKKVWDYNSNQWVNKSSGENGWTLNCYYACYSHGGPINDAAVHRIYNINDDNNTRPEDRIFDPDWMNGNYTPMVAFKYAGYNVIGFEDTPIYRTWFSGEESDLDWNDCIFIANGNFEVPDYNEQDIAWSMCMEDLGDTDDLDYNDLYMVVVSGYEEITYPHVVGQQDREPDHYFEPAKVFIDMAGGVLPLKVEFAPDWEYNDGYTDPPQQVLFDEVHKVFALANEKQEHEFDSVAINTFGPITSSSYPNETADNFYDLSINHPTMNAGDIVDVYFTDGAKVACVRGLGDIMAELDFGDNADAVMANFSILDNIPNFKITVTYPDGEKALINGPRSTDNDSEHQYVNIGNKTDKIPYAFWFPSTAPNLEWSLAHPETQVKPGHEREWIGHALSGFEDWVKDQHAEGAKWYQWKWGFEANWVPGSEPIGGGSSQGLQWNDTNPKYENKWHQDNNMGEWPYNGYFDYPNEYVMPTNCFANFSETTNNVIKIKLMYKPGELNDHQWRYAHIYIQDATTGERTNILNPNIEHAKEAVITINAAYGPRLKSGADLLVIEWWTGGASNLDWNVPENIQYYVGNGNVGP